MLNSAVRERTLSVLIPTWQRPESLRRCLRAVHRQSRRPDQIVVTIREDDAPTWAIVPQLIAELGPVFQAVSTPAVNLRDAMNLGLSQTTGSLVAMTDDDAEPHTDWLEKLVAGFTSDRIGGVGGRDWQPHERWNEPVVGRLAWYGRVVGNHHLGSGPARSVELLKGANCCFRGDVLRRIGFDRRLRGQGNVSHWEMSLCFAFLREGFTLVYDPAIAVDHHVEQRHDGDVNARGGFEVTSFTDGVHNEVVALCTHLSGVRKVLFRTWQYAIGTRGSPGVLQVIRQVFLRRETLGSAIARFRAVRTGTHEANRTLATVRDREPDSIKERAPCV